MKSDWSGVISSILRLFVGTVGLVAIELVIQTLPMMRDLPTVVLIIISSITWTLLIVVILWFGWDMKIKLPFLLPRFTDAGNMVFALSSLIAVIVGYLAYKRLVPPLSDLSWVYSLAFLLLALSALGWLVVLAYINIEKLTHLGKETSQDLVQQTSQDATSVTPQRLSSKRAGPPPEGLAQQSFVQRRCPKCGWTGTEEDIFCGSCGQKLISSDSP